MKVNIRKIEEKDNKIVASIIRSCFHDFQACTAGTVYEDPSTDELYQYFKIEHAALFVAENENEVLGCCGIYPTEALPDAYAELVKFYLKKEARGKGIGKKLLQVSLDFAKSEGYKTIYIESLPAFSTAVSIYEKEGFRYLPKALGNSGHSGCNLWMEKTL